MRALLLSGLVALVLAAPPAWAVSPDQAASYCYDQAKKMGFSSRDMENRSWEDCMTQFRHQGQPPPAAAPGLSPQERAVILQHMLNSQQNGAAANPGTAAGAGALRSLCNSQGGYYTPDGQCLRPQPPPRTPSYSCRRIGNTVTCDPD
jgi:hypothetical protein